MAASRPTPAGGIPAQRATTDELLREILREQRALRRRFEEHVGATNDNFRDVTRRIGGVMDLLRDVWTKLP